MTSNTQQLREELALFADLGTTPPQEAGDDEHPVFRLTREGQRLELRFDAGVRGKVVERALDSGVSREHESYRALLASEKFGDLRKWASSQEVSLENTLRGDLRRWTNSNEASLEANLHDIDRQLIEVKGTVEGNIPHQSPPVYAGPNDGLMSVSQIEDLLAPSPRKAVAAMRIRYEFC